MIATGDLKGIIIFSVILVVATLVAILAYGMTGDGGIEDRYNQAVGLPTGREEGAGFSLEGNPGMYMTALGLLIIACYLLYRRFMAQSIE